jgi:hypothetical protein
MIRETERCALDAGAVLSVRQLGLEHSGRLSQDYNDDLLAAHDLSDQSLGDSRSASRPTS